jgi:hypothetical protein
VLLDIAPLGLLVCIYGIVIGFVASDLTNVVWATSSNRNWIIIQVCGPSVCVWQPRFRFPATARVCTRLLLSIVIVVPVASSCAHGVYACVCLCVCVCVCVWLCVIADACVRACACACVWPHVQCAHTVAMMTSMVVQLAGEVRCGLTPFTRTLQLCPPAEASAAMRIALWCSRT